MATLGQANNTRNPALAVLKSKDYRLRESCNEQTGDWKYHAFKDNYEFVAFEPEALLGIVNIRETYGVNWQSAMRGVDFDESEMYNEDAEGNITAVITDKNGTRTIIY